MNKETVISFYLKYRIFIYPILVGLASIFLITLVVWPQIRGLLLDRQDFDKVKSRLELLQVKAQTLEGLDENGLKERLNIALSSLPADQDFATMVGVIQEISTSSGMSLVALQTAGSAPPVGSSQSFLLKMEVVGSRVGLVELLDSIDKASRVMKISSIELNFSKGGDAIDAAVAVEVFYSAPPQQLGSIDQQLPIISDEDQKLLVTLSSSLGRRAAAPVLLPRGKSNPFE